MRQLIARSPLWVGILLMALLSGCDHDRPIEAPPPLPPQDAPPSSSSPLDSDASNPASSAAVGGGGGASGGGSSDDSSGLTTSDPLLRKKTGQTTTDPLQREDPLQGRSMPTDHSHWLRGRLREARVTVRLNGIRFGSFSSVVDQDITMRLRKGLNSVTFDYEPGDPNASAQMEILESEHNPPIPPLVTFHSPYVSSTSAPQTLSQTFTFMAN